MPTPLATDQTKPDSAHGKALALLLLCVALSVAANVLVASGANLIGQFVHAWPPIALALTAHIVWLVRGRSRWVTVVCVALLVLVAGVAGWISYGGLRALAETAQMSAQQAAWFPLTVDGLGLAAGIAFAAGRSTKAVQQATEVAPAAQPVTVVPVVQQVTTEEPQALEPVLEQTPAVAPFGLAVEPMPHVMPAQEPEALPTYDQPPTIVPDPRGEDRMTDILPQTHLADDHGPDDQVAAVVELLRVDPDVTGEQIVELVPGVASVRTAQRRLKAAREALAAEDTTFDHQLLAVS